MIIKLGDKVWVFIGTNSSEKNKTLAIGEYFAYRDGYRVIRVGKKNYKRRLCDIAKVTGKEKFDFS